MASMEETEDLENLDGVEEVGLDQGASPEEASPVEEEKTTIGIAGYSVSLPTKVVPYVAMELMAVILLIALTTNAFARNSGNYGYGLTVVILAMLLGMAGIYLVTKPALYDKSLATLPMVGPVSLGYGLAVFLSIWWFVGACVLTFSGPFTVTSNGYFASWGGVACSVATLGITTEAVKSSAGTLGFSNALMLASIIQLCAVASELGSQWSATYSLIICILTALLIMGLQYVGTTYAFYAYVLFSILWVLLAILVTFKGPFVETGNGYFSAWLGCLACIYGAITYAP